MCRDRHPITFNYVHNITLRYTAKVLNMQLAEHSWCHCAEIRQMLTSFQMLSASLSFRATEFTFARAQTEDRFSWLFLCSCLPPCANKQLSSRPRSSIILTFRYTENIFTGIRTKDTFVGVDLYFCKLHAKRNNSAVGAILLLCLFPDLRKPSSMGIEPRSCCD
jgi:hypothetical protein